MLPELGPLSWQDRLQQMEITDRLEATDVTASCLSNRHPSQPAMLQALKRMIQANAPDILEHGERTARYALALGNEIDLSGDELTDLRYAALLHDFGKLTLPKAILLKDGALTADEYALVQSHPRAGAKLLEPIPFLQAAAVLIAHHHERWDGSGYPYGLRGSFIPLGSRILAVADTFDVLTSSYSHGQSQSPDIVFRLLQVVAGSQLDPDLVELFTRLAPALYASQSIGSAVGAD